MELLRESCDDFIFAMEQSVSNLTCDFLEMKTLQANLEILKPTRDLFSQKQKSFQIKVITNGKLTSLKILNTVKKHKDQLTVFVVEAKAALFKNKKFDNNTIVVPVYDALMGVLVERVDFSLKKFGKTANRQDIIKLIEHLGNNVNDLRYNIGKINYYFYNKNHLDFQDLSLLFCHGVQDVENKIISNCLNGQTHIMSPYIEYFLNTADGSLNGFLPFIRNLSNKFAQILHFQNLLFVYGAKNAIGKVQPSIFFKDYELITGCAQSWSKSKTINALYILHNFEQNLKSGKKSKYINSKTAFNKMLLYISKLVKSKI